jgi:flagella basal body P-ring formation protein FlgA
MVIPSVGPKGRRRGIAIIPIEGIVLLVLIMAAPAGAQSTTSTLGVERNVPVAARPLSRGIALSPADYQITSVVVRQALKSAAAAESGWVTRRAIAAGEPLIEPAVGPPALVTAGQAVTFVAEAQAVRLSIRGTAATGGSLGQTIWVRMDSGRRLRGVVSAPGTVRADTTSLR